VADDSKGGGLGIVKWFGWLIYFIVISGGLMIVGRDTGILTDLTDAPASQLQFRDILIVACISGLIGALLWPKARLIARIVKSTALIGIIMGAFGLGVQMLIKFEVIKPDPKKFDPDKLWVYIGIAVAAGIGLQVKKIRPRQALGLHRYRGCRRDRFAGPVPALHPAVEKAGGKEEGE
jgi:hypothetical protein